MSGLSGEKAFVCLTRVDGCGHALHGEELLTHIEQQTNAEKNRDITTADLAQEFFLLYVKQTEGKSG